MRALIVILCLTLSPLGMQLVCADSPAETFSITNYRLAYAKANKLGSTVNEYVPRGETLENWTSLIAVREWKNENDLQTVIGYYMQNIKDFKVKEPAPYSVKGKSSKNEQVFEVFLAPSNKSHLEYSIVRFVRSQADRSVKFYQLSYRGEYNLRKAQQFSAEMIRNRIETISSFDLPLYTESDVEEVSSEGEGTSDDEDSDDEVSDDEVSDDEVSEVESDGEGLDDEDDGTEEETAEDEEMEEDDEDYEEDMEEDDSEDEEDDSDDE